MTTSGTTSDNEWQRVVQRMTANNKKWQWVTANDKEWWNEWIRMRASKIEWFYCNWTQIQNHLVHKWVCVCELSGCGFESSCSHLNFRFRTCFEQGVPWHSGNYRVWFHSETCTWHDKNIQSEWFYVSKETKS